MRKRPPLQPEAIRTAADRRVNLLPKGATERDRLWHMLASTIQARGLDPVFYLGTPHQPRDIEFTREGKPRLGVICEAVEDLAKALGFHGTTRLYAILFNRASLGVDAVNQARATVDERLKEVFGV